MINVMLDELPDEWHGYKFNTDFRIGMQVALAQADKTLSKYEKLQCVIDLLFGEDGEYPEENAELEECIDFFLNGWNTDNFTKRGKKKSAVKTDKRYMDFDHDQWRIYSAFLTQYRINLAECEMHWWEFMGLLTCLDECAYTRVIEVRQKKKTSKMSKKEKDAIDEAKRIYALEEEEEPEYTAEEQQRINNFMKYRKKYKKSEPEPESQSQ